MYVSISIKSDENNKLTKENVRCTQTWLLCSPILTTLSNKVK